MPLASFALVILAAFTHATWNLLAKRAADAGVAFIFAYNLVACVAYAPWAIWLIASGKLPLGLPALACIAASGTIHLAYSVCLQRGYQLADLSVVYPIARGTGPLLSTTGAFLLLGEPATGTVIAGMLCLVIGVLLIATQGRLAIFKQAQAWIGVLGQNPRKGVTHTTGDVVGELADVVFTALVAIASLGADPRQAVQDVVTKASGYLPT